MKSHSEKYEGLFIFGFYLNHHNDKPDLSFSVPFNFI
ncbi:MAG: hypothetical protein FD181_2883 [Prolixibacteraceae bacterium]|nr:MAG: hypothetical protein FD181_2883 [Prolixibacteraceae bacterium]